MRCNSKITGHKYNDNITDTCNINYCMLCGYKSHSANLIKTNIT